MRFLRHFLTLPIGGLLSVVFSASVKDAARASDPPDLAPPSRQRTGMLLCLLRCPWLRRPLGRHKLPRPTASKHLTVASWILIVGIDALHHLTRRSLPAPRAEMTRQGAGPGSMWASWPGVPARCVASSAVAFAVPSACAPAAWPCEGQYAAVRSWRRRSASSLRRLALAPVVPFSGTA